MPNPIDASYKLVSLPLHPARRDLQGLVEPYQAMIVTQFRAILDRTERSEHYPWIDSKINLISGEELPKTHPLLGRDPVSGWVQGRGLESISKFAAWLTPFRDDLKVDALIQRARHVAADLLARLQESRRANSGHLHFFMTPAGRAFELCPDGERVLLAVQPGSPYGYSDLFCAKGMYAAANLLEDAAAIANARAFCLQVYGDVLARTFRSDQPQPDTGARPWIQGAFSHGPAMIALGMAALFAEAEPGPPTVDLGLSLARYVLDTHVNLGERWPPFRAYDLVEFVDREGEPFADDTGCIISDPGHSLEFVGLFLKFSRAVRRHGGATNAQLEALAEMEGMMPALLSRAFDNGYRAGPVGICKTVDLLTRAPVDETMPWWSLPETIRAGLAAWQVAADETALNSCVNITALAHNAFVEHYVRPEIHLMAIKVRDGRGVPLDVMPAYPDADPGYHTALSLMDALDLIGAGKA